MKRASRSLNRRATIPISKESRSKQAKAKGQGKKTKIHFIGYLSASMKTLLVSGAVFD
jgi:hypothetical protein